RSPNRSVVVELIEVAAAAGGDGGRGVVVVELLPADASPVRAGGAGRSPDRAGRMQLIERRVVGCDRDRGGIVVERGPSRARTSRAGLPGIAPDDRHLPEQRRDRVRGEI